MTFLHRLLSLFKRAKLDREMDAEMRGHLEREAAANIARGMTPREARRAARRAFGGLDQLKERERDARTWLWIEDSLKDARYAMRQLVHSPGFTFVAVISLALGIGACTAVFSVANAVLLRSLPVPNPHELRRLEWSGTDVRMTSYSGSSNESGEKWTAADSFHPPVFQALRREAVDVADVFGMAPVDDLIARLGDGAIATQGMLVSDNFFSVLQVKPLLGRLLEPGDDFEGEGSRIVLSHRWWENQFGADPAVLGRNITINDHSFTIVGVLSAAFPGVEKGRSCDFYAPMAEHSPLLYMPTLNTDFHWFIRAMARVHPGVSDTRLNAVLTAIFAREVRDKMNDPAISLQPGFTGLGHERIAYREPLDLMFGIVALVMLVACANLAGLSLARGAGRQHEYAVRAALGAQRSRLLRQSLTESVILCAMGAGLGLLVATWGRHAIMRLLAGGNGLHYDLSLDHTVLGFAAAVALAAAVLSGLVPAWQASKAEPLGGLKARGTLRAPSLRAGRFLVAAQISLSLLLLTGAGLLARSLINLAHIDAGFRTDHLLLVQLNIHGSDYADTHPEEYYVRVAESLAHLAGVRDATFIDFPLLSGLSSSGNFDAFSGSPTGHSMQTRRLRVGASFFATMGIPVERGRGFNGADSGDSPKVIVVNQSFVEHYLPDRDPLGLTISIWNADWRIVGVCQDAKYSGLRGDVPPTTYFPYRQMFYGRYRTSHLRTPYFALRTNLPPLSLVPAVRKTLAAIDTGVAVTNVTTQEAVRETGISREHLFATLCGALAGLALLLACIGLYGLMAYHVARRQEEFGIRMALGAQRGDIVRPILREALVLAAFGLGAGLPAVLATTKLIQSLLYQVQPHDPITIVLVATLMVAVAVAAAWLPARHASRIDPIIALRAE